MAADTHSAPDPNSNTKPNPNPDALTDTCATAHA
jgi:hypothetical protein